MTESSMANNLPAEVSEETDFKKYLEITREFFSLIKEIDSLPEVSRVKQDETRSLYRASAKTSKIEIIQHHTGKFFGDAVKPAGKSVPLMLRFNPVFKNIGGLKKSQTLYTKKVSTGVYYTAIWPWTRNPDNMTITMGFCSQKMTDRDYNALEQYIETTILEERAVEEDANGIGGRLRGISLPAFLQMSAMEKTSCTLKVTENDVVGYLYLLDGNLVNAVCGNLEGADAATHIICWDQPEIELEKAVDKVENKIEMPLMHLLMEALKKKDEKEHAEDDLGLLDEPVQSNSSFLYDESVQVLPAVMDDSFVKMHTERSINKARDEIVVKKRVGKKKRIKVFGFLIVAALIVTGVMVFLNHKIDADRLNNEFRTITDGSHDITRQKSLLEEFINRNYESGRIREKAEAKLKNVIFSIETKDFRKLEELVEDLIRVRKYDEAIASCTGYIDIHSESQFVIDAQDQIDMIKKLKAKLDFTDLVEAAETSGKSRIAEKGRLVKDSKLTRETEEFKKFVAEMRDDYYLFVRKNVKRAIRQKRWESGILYCSRYLEIYGENEYAEELKEVKEILSGQWSLKKQLAELISDAESKGNNFNATLRVFTNFQSRNPDSELREKVAQEIQKLKISREQNRLEKEKIRTLSKLKDLSSRFVGSQKGTVLDKKSGLMWTLLDSEAVTGTCMDYQDAQVYVENLTTGGYRNWRFPTADELTGLYKREPFFPNKDINWYWSASVYKKFQEGWRHVVYVIDSEPSLTWQDMQKDSFDCGRVRAVRKAN